MEARSLTALNDLANHPPKYPEAPIRGKGEPFTLYISRVPGTRDIILSPSKPQPNSVTSSDVDNCLYYVHLETPADGSTPSDLARHGWQSRPDAGASAPLTIPRKPVPQAARPLTPESLSSDAEATSKPAQVQNMEVETSDDVVLADPPLPSENGHDLTIDMALETKQTSDRTAAGLHTGMPVRKPLGPRPIDTTIPPTSVPLPDSGISPDRMQDVVTDGNDSPADTLVKSLPLPPVDTSLPSPGLDGSDTQPMAVSPPSSGLPKSRSPSPTGHGSTTTGRGNGSPFALTLIRRDPSSGIQWTVGRIFSKANQLEDIAEHDSGVPATSSQPPLPSVPNSYPPIEVELETSGYAQFRNALFTSMGLQTDPVCDALARGHMEARSKTKGGNDVFSRQLVMCYTKSLGAVFTESLREVLQRIEQAGLSKIGRNRSDSTASAMSNSSDPRETRETVDTIVTAGPPPQGMRAKGYVFLSPWGRKCEFSTSPSGRGVYCRHMPREAPVHDPSNPLSLEQNGSSILGPPTHVVSELRFSLPSTEKLAEHAKMSKEHLRKANFGKLLRPGNSGNDGEGSGFDMEEFLSPFFANLGGERAGGGSRGKKAKMGKLIIHEDGFKMLDLVVATNIGMWWAAWERNF